MSKGKTRGSEKGRRKTGAKDIFRGKSKQIGFAISKGIVSGRLAKELSSIEESALDLPEEEDFEEEEESEWGESDPDWNSHMDDDDSREDIHVECASEEERIGAVVQEELEERDPNTLSNFRLSLAELVSLVQECHGTSSRRKRQRLLQGQNATAVDFVQDCVDRFRKEEQDEASNAGYVQICEDKEGKLCCKTPCQYGNVDVKGLGLNLEEGQDYSFLDLDWPDGISPVGKREILHAIASFGEEIELIGQKLLEFHRDFFMADNLADARATLIGDEKPAAWQFLASETPLSPERKKECSQRMSAHSDLMVSCVHGNFRLREFYIHSDESWYNTYLPAILMEEILHARPPVPEGTGEFHRGLYNISKIDARIREISGKEKPRIKANEWSQNLSDYNRRQGSQTDTFLGAHSECRLAAIRHIWERWTRKAIPDVENFRVLYEKTLRDALENKPGKKQKGAKHATENAPKLFEPENNLYFLVGCAVIEMLGEIIRGKNISPSILAERMRSTLSRMASEENIILAVPDYQAGHERLLSSLQKNLAQAPFF